MKRKVIGVLAAIAWSCIPAVCRAQDFSADVVYVAPAKAAPSTTTLTSLHQPSRLYVSASKMRLETRGITGTVLLVNSEDHTTVALFPAQKAYQPLASAPSEYFHVQDPENACADWQAASEFKISCEKVGHEELNGRQTVKYQNKNATLAAPVSTVWIDPSLNFVAKWEGRDAGAELRNIVKDEKVSPALFEIPQGYDLLKPKKKGPKGPAK
jgi:hypothetical protein